MATSDQLAGPVGRRLVAMRRIHHAIGTEVNRSSGPVEFHFEDGAILHCDAAGDGESVEVRTAAWQDPFEGRMTPENVEYVSAAGKLTAFDVSGEKPWSKVLGNTLRDVARIAMVSGRIRGLVLDLDGYLVAVYVDSDEVYAALLP